MEIKEETIKATFKLRGTEKEIECIRAKIAALSAHEEVVSLHLIKSFRPTP
jgi:ribosome-interacting GTPase 1